MKKTVSLSDAVVKAFTSDAFTPAEVRRRLSAVAGGVAMRAGVVDWPSIVAANQVGAALRAEAPERVRDAATRWAREVIDWKRLERGEAPIGPLEAIFPSFCGVGRLTLCEAAAVDLSAVYKSLRRTDAVEAGVALVEWVEFGDEAALKRLTALPGTGQPFGSGQSGWGATAERLARVTTVFQPDVKSALRLLAQNLGRPQFVGPAARDLARRLGVDPVKLSPGATCERHSGDQEDLRPLVDLLAALPEHHDVLRETITAWAQSPLLEKKRLPDLLETVPWDDRFDDALPGACVRRWDSLVLSVAGTRASASVAASTQGAARDFKKKRDKAAAKRTPKPTQAELDRAFFDAAAVTARFEQRRLIALGARPDGFVDEDGLNALTWRPGGDPELVHLYAARGCDLDRPGRRGWTVLDDLAWELPERMVNRQWAAEALVRHGAKGRGVDGASPLHLAARAGNAELVEVMLEHGFDATAKAGAGPWARKTPLELARESQRFATIAVLESASGVRRARAS